MAEESSVQRSNTGVRAEYRQYDPESPDEYLPDPDTLKEAYGHLRAHFRRHQGVYGRYQHQLARARIDTTYDIYLATVVRRAAIGGIIAVLVAIAMLVGLAWTDAASVSAVPTGILFGAAAAVIGSLATAAAMLAYPAYVAYERAQEIDIALPHVTIFMRTASRINPNPVHLVEQVARQQAIYGELAAEFATIHRDVEVFNDDLIRALENADRRVPNNRLRDFLDDLESLLQSGGRMEMFLAGEVDRQLAHAEMELEETLRRLDTLGPLFVVLVTVVPVVIMTTMIVLDMIGSNVITQLLVLTYVGIPLLVVGSYVLLDGLVGHDQLVPTDKDHTVEDDPSDEGPPWFTEYRSSVHKRRRIARLKRPVETLKHRPIYSFLLTIPTAVLLVGTVVATGVATPSLAALVDQPAWTTTFLVVVPFVVVTLPLSILHEIQIRQSRAFEERFPDALRTLGSATDRGVPLDGAIELIAERYEGSVAAEFGRVHRDIQLEHDIDGALGRLAKRRQLPRITVLVAVLRQLVRTSEDLGPSLEALATDLQTRVGLEKRRRAEMSTHVVVVGLGVAVYLVIVLVLDAFLLPQIPDIGVTPGVGMGEQPAENLYQMIFFHSSLVLAAGSGLIMGKLSQDSPLAGLKYINALVLVVVLAFGLAALV